MIICRRNSIILIKIYIIKCQQQFSDKREIIYALTRIPDILSQIIHRL